MAASLAAPRGLLIFVLTCCIFAGVRGNLTRLFSANSPAFVNVSDLKSSFRTLVENVGSRLRCEEHGLKHVECVKVSCFFPSYLVANFYVAIATTCCELKVMGIVDA